MASKEHYDLLVFIGRFQPFHAGHKKVIELALERADQVLMLVGSSYQPRTIKNPFTYDERLLMISSSLEPTEVDRVSIIPIRDYLYNDQKWLAQVQQIVEARVNGGGFVRTSNKNDYIPHPKTLSVGIIGYDKDESSWYLTAFPQYDFINVGRNYVDTIDATKIRELWLDGHSPNFTSGVLRDSVHNFMYKKFPKKEYERLQRELKLIKQVKDEKAVYKYPIIDHTVDAVVIQSGHVLLVKRKSAPGEGLFAIPGGYLNPNETLVDGMIRELREETKIKVPEPVLRGSIKAQHCFDAPGRSLRGRIITQAFLIQLAPGPLPQVKGSDDAAKAKWVPLSEFEKMEEQMFEDHSYIIQYFLGRV
jgi:bifunctional NMN adenylyltransferase/nudix hydrolase